MQQVHNRGNLDLDEDAYFAIIRGKTAELTAVSCRLGAHYAGAATATVVAMEDYGRDLGVAFQIADDVLDIWGDERTTGKSLGTDLEKQKLTLPLIRLLAVAPGSDRRHGSGRILAEARPEGRRALRADLEQSGALEYAWDRARHYAAAAVSRLDQLPDSPPGPSSGHSAITSSAGRPEKHGVSRFISHDFAQRREILAILGSSHFPG